MDWKIGDKVKSECVACGEEEIWEVETITNEEYSDGMFKTYNLKAIKNCFGEGVRRSVKNCEELLQYYKLI